MYNKKARQDPPKKVVEGPSRHPPPSSVLPRHEQRDKLETHTAVECYLDR